MSAADFNDGSNGMPENENLSVVIIASSVGELSPVVSFLDKRGVTVYTFTDLQLAIEAIKHRRPTAVLFSVNFPHPRVELLPTVIQDTFHVDCLAFVENQDRRAMAKLSSCKARHTISSPVSGQVVLLRLRQIQAGTSSDLGRTNKSSISSADKPMESPSTIRISNGTKSPRGKDIILQKGARYGRQAVFYEKRNTKELKASIEAGKLKFSRSFSREEAKHGSQGGSASPAAEEHAEEKLLRRCAREALAQFCETQRVSQDFLNEYSSAWVMKMKTAKVNATLVLAMGPTAPGQNPQEMLKLLINSFVTALKSKNIEPSLSDSKLIQVQDFIAVSDALLLSSFFAHNKRFAVDVSVAIFPHAKDAVDLHPEMTPTENGMFSVPISSLRQNVTPGFDAFLFLPRNQKFVQYLRRGASMPSQQTSALVSRGITHFLISKEDAVAYNRYHALSHIFKKTGS